MRSIQLTLVILTGLVLTLNSCNNTTELSKKLERPFIWVKASERNEILNKIENNDWAKELFETLRKRADKTTSSNLTERRQKLLVLPLVWSDDSSTAPKI